MDILDFFHNTYFNCRRNSIFYIYSIKQLGTYIIKNSQENKQTTFIRNSGTYGLIDGKTAETCLAIPSNKPDNAVPIVGHTECQDTPGQKWKIVGNSIVNNIGNCINIPNNSSAVGTVLDQHSCNSSDSQRWSYEIGTRQIKNINGLCMTLKEQDGDTDPTFNTNNDNYGKAPASYKITQETCGDNDWKQRWFFTDTAVNPNKPVNKFGKEYTADNRCGSIDISGGNDKACKNNNYCSQYGFCGNTEEYSKKSQPPYNGY